MKAYLLLLLALASCATFAPHPVQPGRAEPIYQVKAYREAFDGHPPVVMMDLEAAPDSIATVVAEQYFLPRKQARKFLRHATRLTSPTK